MRTIERRKAVSIAPIGTVIHLSGDAKGSWLKINHRTDVPTSLMVQHFAEAQDAMLMLVEARAYIAKHTNAYEVTESILKELE
jgi:hypothetical protein